MELKKMTPLEKNGLLVVALTAVGFVAYNALTKSNARALALTNPTNRYKPPVSGGTLGGTAQLITAGSSAFASLYKLFNAPAPSDGFDFGNGSGQIGGSTSANDQIFQNFTNSLFPTGSGGSGNDPMSMVDTGISGEGAGLADSSFTAVPVADSIGSNADFSFA